MIPVFYGAVMVFVCGYGNVTITNQEEQHEKDFPNDSGYDAVLHGGYRTGKTQ